MLSLVSVPRSERVHALQVSLDRVDWAPVLYQMPTRFPSQPDAFYTEVLTEYKKFLLLKVLYRDWDDEFMSAENTLDTVWHEHLSNTEKYKTDCVEAFGKLLRCRPLYVSRDPHVLCGRRMMAQAAYVQVFHTLPPAHIWGFDECSREYTELERHARGVTGMVIHMLALNGERHEMEVRPSMTIEEVKAEYEKRTGKPKDKQRLVYAGKQLEDGRTLRDYNIPHDGSIHLLMRLRGC